MAEPPLSLPQVTLCAVTSVNVAATVIALERCLEQIDFAACKLLTDVTVNSAHRRIEVVPITRIGTAAAYSNFMLKELPDHIQTSHCLVVQWDGYVLDAKRWRNEFLDYDYIGASWPQFDDGHDVGNGGFSLRTRRLMDLCRDPAFSPIHPEDVAIGRTNRNWLEEQGMRFAPRSLADLFAAERTADPQETFGYHGVWNMLRGIGSEGFWQVYCELDEHTALKRDFVALLKNVYRGRQGNRRALHMLADRIIGRSR